MFSICLPASRNRPIRAITISLTLRAVYVVVDYKHCVSVGRSTNWNSFLLPFCSQSLPGPKQGHTATLAHTDASENAIYIHSSTRKMCFSGRRLGTHSSRTYEKKRNEWCVIAVWRLFTSKFLLMSSTHFHFHNFFPIARSKRAVFNKYNNARQPNCDGRAEMNFFYVR